MFDESPPSLSFLVAMQMDYDLPVHLNMHVSMFKQWWHVKKYKNILLVYYRIPSLIRRDGYA